MVLRGMAGRLAPRRNLRHVDDRSDAGFLRGLREIGCSSENPRCDRVKEVGGADALHGCTDVVDVGEISDGDVNAACPQRRCALVVRAHVSAYALAHVAAVRRWLLRRYGRLLRLQDGRFVHGFDPLKVKTHMLLCGNIEAYAPRCKFFNGFGRQLLPAMYGASLRNRSVGTRPSSERPVTNPALCSRPSCVRAKALVLCDYLMHI